jgi:hypothetical protein
MVAQPSYVPLRRVSRREPCPICGHTSWCRLRDDGAVLCNRVESDRPASTGNGWWHRLPERADPAASGRVHWTPEDLAAASTTPATPAGAQIADAATRHTVYSALLAACPPSPEHRAHLTGARRRLPAEALGDYGTVPARKAQAGMLAALGMDRATLLGVPGILEDGAGLRLGWDGGILIPYRDAQGRIQAMQVYRFDEAPKYPWLSSARVGGPSSGAPAHVARPRVLRDRRVYIVEGALKAAIVAAQLGAVVVGVAGHGNWRAALPAVHDLQGEGADVAVVALDVDAKPETAAAVEQSRGALAAELASTGWAVRIARWPHDGGKGLDDLLLGGGAFALELYRPGLAMPTPPAGDDHPDGLAPGPLSDARKLRILANVLLNMTMKPTDKVVLCVSYLLTGAWPGSPDVEHRKPILTIAKRVNAARSTVSRSVGFHEERGLLRVLRKREDPPPPPAPPAATSEDAGDPKIIAFFRPGRALGYDEEMPPAEFRMVDKKRRCPHCGSTRLVPHTVRCTRCDAIVSVREAEEAEAAYQQGRYAAESESAQDSKTEESCSAEDPPPPPPPVVACADSDSDTGAASAPHITIVPQEPDEDAMAAWERAQRRRHAEIGARIDAGRSPQHRPASPGPAPSVEWPRSTEGWPPMAAAGAGP